MGKPARKETKEFKPSVGFWAAKNGTGYSVYIDETVQAKFAELKVGGTLFLQEVPKEQREKNTKAPLFRVTIFEPSDQDSSTQDNVL